MHETSLFLPIIILLGVSSAICLVVSLLKFRLLPTFVFEVIAGIALGPIFIKYFKDHNFEQMINFLYVIGFSMIMFLSGYDANLKLFKDKRKNTKTHINIVRTSIFIIIMIYIVGLIASLLFIKEFDKVALGIILLTITFSSTFAGVVAPLISVEHLHGTYWGKFVVTFSFLNELISVVLLTIFMVANNISINNLIGYLIIIGIFFLMYLILKIRRGRRIEEGMVFFSTKIIIVALAASVYFSELGGGEYVLGAFLLGFFLRLVKLNHHKMKYLEAIGYGMFIPMFFVTLGMKIDIVHIFAHPNMILMALLLFAAFMVVKLPLLYLFNWYRKGTVFTTIALASVTLVVAATAEHLGVHYEIFSHEFGQSLLLAAVLTTIIGPLVFEISCFGPLRHLRAQERAINYEDIELS